MNCINININFNRAEFFFIALLINKHDRIQFDSNFLLVDHGI